MSDSESFFDDDYGDEEEDEEDEEDEDDDDESEERDHKTGHIPSLLSLCVKGMAVMKWDPCVWRCLALPETSAIQVLLEMKCSKQFDNLATLLKDASVLVPLIQGKKLW